MFVMNLLTERLFQNIIRHDIVSDAMQIKK